MDIENLKSKFFGLAFKGQITIRQPDEKARPLLENIKNKKLETVPEKKRKNSSFNSYIFKEGDIYFEKVGDSIKRIEDDLTELPFGWEYSRLGNFVKIVTDYVASGSFKSLNENVKYYKDENYAILVRTCDFKTNFSESLIWTDKHGYEFLNNSNLFGGELLLSNIGASIGKVFIVPKLEKRMTLAPNSVMVKTYDEISTKYLYYFFLSPQGQKLLQSISSSSAQAKFNKTDFKNLIIPIPSLDEQRRICDTLEKVESLINKINAEKKTIDKFIEEAKAKLLNEVFVSKKLFAETNYNKQILGEILHYEQPGPYIVNSVEYSDSYSTPVLTPGKSFILGYTNETSGVYKPNPKVIIFDDFTTASRLIDFDFKVKSSAMKILSISEPEKYNIDYLFLLLQTIHINSDTHKRFWISEYAPLSIEIHSYETQIKIVNFVKQVFEKMDMILNQ